MNVFFIGVIVSVIVYLIVGIWAGKHVKDVNDYYVSGRNAPTLLIAGTLFAFRQWIYGGSGLVLHGQHHLSGIAELDLRGRLCIWLADFWPLPAPVRMHNDAGILW